ncbi:unknown protein [Seminavis robusta]|uniref:Uncharacterized protein n=1 Tax=Seminavis robusta TaxID=568900 RepID=A0A9N8EW23_9STRA|nr:unknown protein [Seminavis robusta]|eukprot:Sro2073_g313490.1 n/a (381) ;mRNA; f:14880-16022
MKVQLKVMNIKHADIGSTVVAAVVGQADYSAALCCLKKNPYKEVDFIPFELKKKTKHFAKELELHNIIVNSGGAVKITQTNRDFIEGLRQARLTDFNLKHKVIDIAATSHTSDSGTYYVQCLRNDKEIVHKATETFLNLRTIMDPQAPIPKLTPLQRWDGATIYPNSTANSEEYDIKSKYKHLLADDITTTGRSSIASNQMARSLPTTIDAQKPSFAEALVANLNNPQQQDASSIATSQLSSPGNTVKTQREEELEDENADLKMKVHNLTYDKEALTHTLETMQSQIDQLTAAVTALSDQVLKSPARKKQDSKGTPIGKDASPDIRMGTPGNYAKAVPSKHITQGSPMQDSEPTILAHNLNSKFNDQGEASSKGETHPSC